MNVYTPESLPWIAPPRESFWRKERVFFVGAVWLVLFFGVVAIARADVLYYEGFDEVDSTNLVHYVENAHANGGDILFNDSNFVLECDNSAPYDSANAYNFSAAATIPISGEVYIDVVGLRESSCSIFSVRQFDVSFDTGLGLGDVAVNDAVVGFTTSIFGSDCQLAGISTHGWNDGVPGIPVNDSLLNFSMLLNYSSGDFAFLIGSTKMGSDWPMGNVTAPVREIYVQSQNALCGDHYIDALCIRNGSTPFGCNVTAPPAPPVNVAPVVSIEYFLHSGNVSVVNGSSICYDVAQNHTTFISHHFDNTTHIHNATCFYTNDAVPVTGWLEGDHNLTLVTHMDDNVNTDHNGTYLTNSTACDDQGACNTSKFEYIVRSPYDCACDFTPPFFFKWTWLNGSTFLIPFNLSFTNESLMAVVDDHGLIPDTFVCNTTMFLSNSNFSANITSFNNFSGQDIWMGNNTTVIFGDYRLRFCCADVCGNSACDEQYFFVRNAPPPPQPVPSASPDFVLLGDLFIWGFLVLIWLVFAIAALAVRGSSGRRMVVLGLVQFVLALVIALWGVKVWGALGGTAVMLLGLVVMIATFAG